jgi:hypothetical protein
MVALRGYPSNKARTRPIKASQFFRYLPGTVGDLDRDKNARRGVIKLNKKQYVPRIFGPI